MVRERERKPEMEVGEKRQRKSRRQKDRKKNSGEAEKGNKGGK